MSTMPFSEQNNLPDSRQLEDLKLAASKMLGEKRRAFQAAMVLKYCSGSSRQSEKVLGWSRQAVELGLHEKRTGLVCLNQHQLLQETNGGKRNTRK